MDPAGPIAALIGVLFDNPEVNLSLILMPSQGMQIGREAVLFSAGPNVSLLNPTPSSWETRSQKPLNPGLHPTD